MQLAAAAAVGVFKTGVGVVESCFVVLLFDLFEYDMSGIAAGARTFTETYRQKACCGKMCEYLNSV